MHFWDNIQKPNYLWALVKGNKLWGELTFALIGPKPIEAILDFELKNPFLVCPATYGDAATLDNVFQWVTLSN